MFMVVFWVDSGQLTFPSEVYTWQLGVQLCIMTGLPTHLEQELNVATVLLHHVGG